MRNTVKRAVSVGAISLAFIGIAMPNAQAASKSVQITLPKTNGCKAKLYIDDHAVKGKVRGQAHVWCTKGAASVTPAMSMYRDGKMVIRTKGPGLRAIDKGEGIGFSYTTKDNKGTQCYKATLLIQYVGLAGAYRKEHLKTPCLNT